MYNEPCCHDLWRMKIKTWPPTIPWIPLGCSAFNSEYLNTLGSAFTRQQTLSDCSPNLFLFPIHTEFSNSSQHLCSEVSTKCAFSSHMYAAQPLAYIRYSLTFIEKLWSCLGAETDGAELLTSTNYKLLQSSNSFGRPKHFSVWFYSLKKLIKLCFYYMESNVLQNPLNRMTILQLALLGTALFSLHSREASLCFSAHCSERSHTYHTFPFIHLGSSATVNSVITVPQRWEETKQLERRYSLKKKNGFQGLMDFLALLGNMGLLLTQL